MWLGYTEWTPTRLEKSHRIGLIDIQSDNMLLVVTDNDYAGGDQQSSRSLMLF